MNFSINQSTRIRKMSRLTRENAERMNQQILFTREVIRVDSDSAMHTAVTWLPFHVEISPLASFSQHYSPRWLESFR